MIFKGIIQRGGNLKTELIIGSFGIDSPRLLTPISATARRATAAAVVVGAHHALPPLLLQRHLRKRISSGKRIGSFMHMVDQLDLHRYFECLTGKGLIKNVHQLKSIDGVKYHLQNVGQLGLFKAAS